MADFSRICDRCGAHISEKKDGTLFKHKNLRQPGRPVCKGSGK